MCADARAGCCSDWFQGSRRKRPLATQLVDVTGQAQCAESARAPYSPVSRLL